VQNSFRGLIFNRCKKNFNYEGVSFMMFQSVSKVIAIAVFCVVILLGAVMGEVSAANKIEGKLNINTATVNDFTLLPGIGPSKAQAIITYRDTKGKFAKIEDLAEVKGIGRKTLLKLEPYLKLDGTSDLKVVPQIDAKTKAAPTPEPKNEKGKTSN
jgi:comEA protein